jgi:hypothetical protein
MNAPAGPVLRDIHLPPPPGWWPPAPGWWVLAALVLAICVFATYKLWRAHRHRQRVRAGLREFESCVAANRENPAGLAAALSVFLRRLACSDEKHAASLTGERWLEYLDARAGGEEFRRGIGRVLLDAPFRAHSEYDGAALIALVRRYAQRSFEAGHA